MGRIGRVSVIAAVVALVGVLLGLPTAPAGAAPPPGAAGYWTPERLAAATPRDLVVDARGQGYLRRADGSLAPHGHAQDQLFGAGTAGPSRPVPAARPGGGGGDTTGPAVSSRVPGAGATIGASATFSATVTDPSGVRSVSFVIVYPNGTQTSSFAATASGSTYSITVSGFTTGNWSWYVVARDSTKGAGNATTTATTGFAVNTGDGGGGGVVTNSAWTGEGPVQTAAGRIYFEMPANRRLTSWTGYVCSGTVAQDATTGRSIILTAAHCVFDDVYKAFARNVLFIPNQAGTSGPGTDTNCANDPLGCWAPAFGVVDTDWTTRTFPANTPWDYGYYVVDDAGAHTGAGAAGALDSVAGSLGVQFAAPVSGARTHALGYSYSDDPDFMYCAEDLALESGGDWWLGHCGLSGGASGGPWMQSDDGSGPIISVNSWGYTNQPGMAGPRLDTSSASCVLGLAIEKALVPPAGRGYSGC